MFFLCVFWERLCSSTFSSALVANGVEEFSISDYLTGEDISSTSVSQCVHDTRGFLAFDISSCDGLEALDITVTKFSISNTHLLPDKCWI